MKIIDKIRAKNDDFYRNGPVTIAFLGDSVTHGCFDCYFDENDNINTCYVRKDSYAQKAGEMLNLLFPAAQVNIINSGISGDNAYGGNLRFDRDIKPFSPDLVVVSYGLNDCGEGPDKIPFYGENLASIFAKVKETGAECIFLTQNMMCTKVSCHLEGEKAKALAEFFSNTENAGTLEKYFEEGKKVAKENGVKVCDIYSSWRKMYENGVDVTELLANRYNHPIKEMHYYTAVKLIETMFE